MRWIALVSGCLMAAAYARLHEAVVFRSEMGKSFLLINQRESLFWLSHYLLLVPGFMLIAWALAPWLKRSVGAVLQRRAEADTDNTDINLPGSARQALLAVGFGTFLFILAWLGRALFLLDLPITNDEYTILFGARIVAEGMVTAPDIDPDYAFSMPWIFRQGGRIASMDFPGTILFTALSLVTGLEELLFFLLAAASGTALVWACGRLDPGRGLGVAAVFWVFSPMVTTLSFTLHSHLVSRSFVAFAFALYILVVTTPRPTAAKTVWSGAALGLCAALGLTSRPAEVATVLAPMALDLLWRAYQHGKSARLLAATAALTASLGPMLMAWWNIKTTGVWHTSARVLVNKSLDDPLWPAAWERLGENLGFNLMMLILWFIGPLGAALVALALKSGNRVARVAAAGVACQLAMALLHDSTGIRIVGPIHYSEAAVPLLILAVLGLKETAGLLRKLDIDASTPTTLLVFYMLSLGIWTGIHTGSLVDQAIIHRTPLDAVADLEQAIVIADRPSELWFSRQEIEDVSSWLADLPHPDPFLRNEVIFAYPEANIERLRRDFPKRSLYRMTYHAEGELVRLRPLDP